MIQIFLLSQMREPGSAAQTGLRLRVVRVGPRVPHDTQIFTDESRRFIVSSQVTGLGVSNEGYF